MQRFLFSLLFLFCHLPFAEGQVDSILSFPDDQRMHVINEWFLRERHRGTYEANVERFTNVYQGLLDRKEEALARIMWSLRIWHQYYLYSEKSADTSHVLLRKEIERAADRGWTTSVLEAKYMLGFILFIGKHYGEGLELMLHNYAELEKVGWSTPYFRSLANQTLGDAFYKFGDYANSIRYFKEDLAAAAVLEVNGQTFNTLNTLGLCYNKLMRYDSAEYYFKEAFRVAATVPDSAWMALIMGNLGMAYFRTGQYDKAREALEYDYRESINLDVIGSAANAGTILANLELRKGNTVKAEEYIAFSSMHMDTSNLEGMVNFMDNLYTYHKLKGDYRLAVAYADSLKTYTRRKEETFDDRLLNQAEIKVQIARYNADVKGFEEARKRQIIFRNSLLVILLLIGLLAMLWIKRIMLKRKADQEKLAAAQNQLNLYTKSLLEKNELIQSFREELDKLRASDDQLSHDRSAHISALMHTTIFTDEDWRQFRTLFDAVYPGFLVRLKDKFNDLTPAEMRILALTKLQLPSKDMAEMLGISPDSIKKTRYRLRKKINLPEEGTLEELVAMI